VTVLRSKMESSLLSGKRCGFLKDFIKAHQSDGNLRKELLNPAPEYLKLKS